MTHDCCNCERTSKSCVVMWVGVNVVGSVGVIVEADILREVIIGSFERMKGRFLIGLEIESCLADFFNDGRCGCEYMNYDQLNELRIEVYIYIWKVIKKINT